MTRPTADVSGPAARLRFKKARLGPLLLGQARRPEFFRQVHVIFGGTGAVGGATALQLVSLFDEALSWRRGEVEDRPRIVVSGRKRSDIRQFTTLFFAVHKRDHGSLPERVAKIGYRTATGVLLELTDFAVDPSIPGLEDFPGLDEAGGRQAVGRLLETWGLDEAAGAPEKLDLLERLLREEVGQPFSEFLTAYREKRGLFEGVDRFRSVVLGIPVASIAAYRLPGLEQAAILLGAEPGSARIDELKETYLEALRDDLGRVRADLADEVLVAHTTAVGGMYDEESDGRRTIRLGFAHSALDERLRDKQIFAEKLVSLYSEVGVKMLVTAAAIGVDGILVRHSPPMNVGIRRLLQEAETAGRPAIPKSDLNQRLKIYPPHVLELLDEREQPISLERGRPLVLEYVLRSGENGYFSPSNADALYRVMRVTSSSELGLLLARSAMFGDEDASAYFRDGSCYYTETDNSRQVFDLLAQPQLQKSQISGLQPKALQDLGSAKHQAELHLLGLLILLHRLKNLDLEALPPHPDLGKFDPRQFFEEHSPALTLDRIEQLDLETLARELRILATARDPGDLRELKSFFQADPDRQEAASRVLQAALLAAWAVPSLGTPILYESDDRRRVVAGYYAAAIDRVVNSRNAFRDFLRDRFEQLGGQAEEDFERFVEFHVANNGFADIRPLAVLVTARSDAEELRDKVAVFYREEDFVAALRRLEPYSYFTTSGLIALLVRLRGLRRLAHELDFTLGTANEFRAHLPWDHRRHPLLVPGVVEAFRMVSEGLEKNTGLERLDGRWGYYV